MDDIKEVVLCLENLDSITIPRQYIGAFYLGGFKRSIARRASNWIGEMLCANKFQIEINVDANQEETNINYGKRYPFDRLTQFKDIAQVEIIYKAGKKESYYVDYDDGDKEGILGADNIFQQAKLNSFGDLFITIGKDIQIDEVFPDEAINDKDSRNLQWDMYS